MNFLIQNRKNLNISFLEGEVTYISCSYLNWLHAYYPVQLDRILDYKICILLHFWASLLEFWRGGPLWPLLSLVWYFWITDWWNWYSLFSRDQTESKCPPEVEPHLSYTLLSYLLWLRHVRLCQPNLDKLIAWTGLLPSTITR